MKTNKCSTCQYWRDESWCSNSESYFSRKNTDAGMSCERYVKRGEKAPLSMRAGIKLLRGINRRMKK